MDQFTLYQALFKLQESNQSSLLLFPNLINLQEQLLQQKPYLQSPYADDIPSSFIDNSNYGYSKFKSGNNVFQEDDVKEENRFCYGKENKNCFL